MQEEKELAEEESTNLLKGYIFHGRTDEGAQKRFVAAKWSDYEEDRMVRIWEAESDFQADEPPLITSNFWIKAKTENLDQTFMPIGDGLNARMLSVWGLRAGGETFYFERK